MSFPQILTLVSLLALLVACSEQVPSSSASDALKNSNAQTAANASAAPGLQQPPFGAPPGGGGPMGGLPPNIEEIRADYPELAAALEEMQDLDPEARRAKMDALFAEHPEWQEVLMPPGGPGGPGGMPPGGGPGGMPPGGMMPPQASASPAS